jgi:hypothetical protein
VGDPHPGRTSLCRRLPPASSSQGKPRIGCPLVNFLLACCLPSPPPSTTSYPRFSLRKIMMGECLPSPPSTPPDLHDLLQRCWALQPNDRPACAEIVAALERLQKACLAVFAASRSFRKCIGASSSVHIIGPGTFLPVIPVWAPNEIMATLCSHFLIVSNSFLRISFPFIIINTLGTKSDPSYCWHGPQCLASFHTGRGAALSPECPLGVLTDSHLNREPEARC